MDYKTWIKVNLIALFWCHCYISKNYSVLKLSHCDFKVKFCRASELYPYETASKCLNFLTKKSQFASLKHTVVKFRLWVDHYWIRCSLVADPTATSRDRSEGDFCLWNFINVGDQTYSMSYKHGAHSSNAKWPHPWKAEVVCPCVCVWGLTFRGRE